MDIQINILDAVAVDYEKAQQYGVLGYEVNQGITFFKIALPKDKFIFRRMEQLVKFRSFIAQKWSGFVPLPQLNLDMVGKQKNNELEVFLINQFVRDISKYNFITGSLEFTALFNEKQNFLSNAEFDQTFKPIILDFKKPDYMRTMLQRYQKIYKIDIASISTSHL